MSAISGYVRSLPWRALVETSNFEPAAGEGAAKWHYPCHRPAK
jgi:hypothetical protein